MTFPWNCLMCPMSSFNNSPTLMLYKLVKSRMREKLSMFVYMDSPWWEYRSRESPAGVAVEVLGIRKGTEYFRDSLHLANLQCGWQHMTCMPGSGWSRNYSLCGNKENPAGLHFLVWSWRKFFEKPPCHGGSWRANTFECLNLAGKCLALWRQMPLVVGANAFECLGDVFGCGRQRMTFMPGSGRSRN